MKYITVLIIFAIISVSLSNKISSQMKDDGTYTTVYLEDLCSELDKHQSALILDVRSPGENNDTSNIGYLNIGKIKNAVNINIDDLESRLGELETYKNQDIFVYCSHSHRSRVASKLLTEKGFQKVHNINGGLSEWVLDDINCTNVLYTSSLPYKLLSPQKVKELNGSKNAVIVDLRPKDEFDGKSSDSRRNAGRIKNSVNIPLSELEKRLSEIDKDKGVVLCDFDCTLSPGAAKTLVQKGYNNVGILIFGISSWINKTNSDENNLMENLPVYKNLSIEEGAGKLKNNSDNLVFVDVRSKEEFDNKSQDSYKNIGHVKNAINIPAAEINNRLSELSGMKDKEIIVYSNYPVNSDGVCQVLVQNGFKNVDNIFCGIGKLIWAKSNLKGISFPDDAVVNNAQ